MKILIVYYSRTGNTKKVAEEMATILKCDIERIIDLKDRKGIIGWILAGRDGMNKKMTKIEKVKNNPSAYDFVILGSPIWVNLPPAMRTYLHDYSGYFNKAAFFCTMGGSEYQNLFTEMEQISKIKPTASIAITASEVETNKYINKVKDFIKKIKSL